MFCLKKSHFMEGMLIGLAVGGAVASGTEMMMNKNMRKRAGKFVTRAAGAVKAAVSNMMK